MRYSPMPNDVYHIGLSYGAIAVHGYLLHIENRQTYKCYASYKTIGKAVKMSTNTVRKYVQELETRHLIRTETSSIVTRDGRKRNGTLLYNIRPIQEAVGFFYEQQMQAQLSRRCTPQETFSTAERTRHRQCNERGCDQRVQSRAVGKAESCTTMHAIEL